ncbi:MAG: heparin lyase I family protein [Rikenellaceae bacterium]
MQRIFFILIFVTLTFGSANLFSSCGKEDPIEVIPPNPGSEDESDEPIVTGSTLSANGNSSQTYQLIEGAGYGNEAPDLYGVHTSVQHITQSYDQSLERNVFDFHIHIDEDNDRGKETITDRQRNEIKTDDKSPDALLGFKGETVEYRWYFMLPSAMKTTTSFTHVHQIKGIDNDEGDADVSMPIVTFTLRTKSSKQQFEIKYTEPTEDGGDSNELIIADLADFLGQWVEVKEIIKYADAGVYSVEIKRCSDNKILVDLDNVKIKTWRTGTPAMRPKWGIYRHFGENGSNKDQLRDETLKFAEFYINKL